jgi:hypothetical protein
MRLPTRNPARRAMSAAGNLPGCSPARKFDMVRFGSSISHAREWCRRSEIVAGPDGRYEYAGADYD